MRSNTSPAELPHDVVGPEDFDAQGRFLYPGDVEDAMPEGHLAWWLGVYLVQAITRLVADPARDSAHANMPIYYVRGEPRRHVSPDAFFLPGVALDWKRKSYCLWKTGVVPQVTFEVLSRHHEYKDEVVNRQIYQDLGVAEYYWFDPERVLLTALALHPETRRFRKRRPNAAGRYPSQALGLEVGLHDGLIALFQDGAYVQPAEDVLGQVNAALAERDTLLADREAQLAQRDADLAERDAELEALRRRIRDLEDPGA